MLDQLNGTEIALVGMAGRFPGAQNIDEFWQNLCDGIESIRFLNDHELEALGVEAALLHDPNYVKASAALEGMELFDAAFFGYTPREAELMDPQHRIFLECCWEALEDAGYNSETYPGSIGVFGGATTNTYLLYNLMSNLALLSSLDLVQIDVGNGADFLATRASYKLNLRGPSCTIQSACSTSLASVHLACQSLLNEECDMALAGGAAIHVKHPEGYRYLEGGIVSPDGHCRAFDAEAAGTVFGSGAGVVVLKRLTDALDVGDHIHAIIQGSAMNNDGAGKVGYTAPSVEGQAKVITEALAVADVEASSISYVETHGTGTKLGDPIEIRALTKAYHTSTDAKNYCAIGSIKTNIGHLAGAAGIASLIKTVLMLKHKLIPPSLHFEQPNPEIDFANSPFFVNTTLSEWKATNGPHRAGLSSFGMGGTNVHAILQEAPPVEPSVPSRPVQLLLLSAKTDTALETATLRLAGHLEQHLDLNLADAAYTLQVGRQPFNHRRIVICRDIVSAIEACKTRDPNHVSTASLEVQDRPVVFMFPGQGAQYVNVASELYQTEPLFRQQVDACCELLRPHLGLDLRDLLYPAADQAEEAGQQLNQTAITQPTLFVVEYALARLWQAWGLSPQAMIGHSIGEFVAACLAGVFSLEDALALVVMRGQLMQSLPAGAMIALPLPEEAVQSLLSPGLSIAAVNGPALTVVSGSFDAMETLQTRLDKERVAYRRLHTSHAFHSAMMDPILEHFAARVGQVMLAPPEIPYISNVTGTWIADSEAADPAYWVQHLRQAVRFSDGIHTLIQDPSRVFLEVGPGNTLTKLTKRQCRTTQSLVVLPSTPHPRDQQSDAEFLLAALGNLWLAGVDIDWSGFYANESRHRIPLPTYPFERQRYWIEPGKQVYTAPSPTLHKKADIADWFYVPAWKSSPQPIPFQPDALAGRTETWLLFSGSHDLGSDMAKRLREAGQTVVTVTAGEQFGQTEKGAYIIDPHSPADYDKLLKQMDDLPDRILHLWSLTPNGNTLPTPIFFDWCQDLGLYSLIFLAQALSKKDLTDSIQLEVISDHVCHIVEGEEMYPAKITLLGACKVIPQEYPNITCRFVDVIIPDSNGPQNALLIDQLLAEVNSGQPETQVAYRGNQRWVRIYEPAPLRDTGPVLRSLRQNGTYLIVGSSSGLGYVLAEYLAETVQAKLVLVEEATPGDDPPANGNLRHQAEIVRALEELGAQALVLTADVTNEVQIKAAVAQAEARFGQIHGVFYTASITDERIFRPITQTGRAECNWHFERKVHGPVALAKALQDREPDFCLLNGSLSSVLGGLGFAAYTAANLFMDAFVQSQNRRSHFPWISVDWDAWQLGGDAEQIMTLSTDLDQLAMSPAEGKEALRRILATSTSERIVVSTGDLLIRIEQGRQRVDALRKQTSLQPGAALTLHDRPNLPTEYAPPRNDLEHKIAEIWHQVLGIKDIGIYDNFFDLGGHSLLATQLRNHLYETFKVELPLQGLFEHPTVAGVAQLLESSSDRGLDQEGKPIAERLKIAFPTERQGLLEDYLKPKVAHSLGIEIDQIPPDGDLAGFERELVAVDLMWNLKQDLKLQFYPHEIVTRSSLPDLAGFILAEYDRMSDLARLATNKPLSTYTLKPYRKRASARLPSPPAKKNRSMVFLHSSPRAGSTLLRVMLAGHPALFCPPELNILFFEDMQEWRQNIGFGHDFQWTAQGLHWAFVELLGLSSDEGWAFLDTQVTENRSVRSVYAQLQELAGDRLLMDKTPPYAMDMETLNQAENLFKAPRYIFLIRHPYAVIESLLRARFDRLFSPSLFDEHNIDPYVVAETVWALPNRNLLQFFEQIEPERYRLIRYEDLVHDPSTVMTKLCQFLEIPFDETLLTPYDGRRERMMGGLGDPNIFQHTSIDPHLGETWKKIVLPRRLDESTQQLAARLGYELPQEASPSATTRPSFLTPDEAAKEKILEELDGLSDKEVYAMLSDLMQEEKEELDE